MKITLVYIINYSRWKRRYVDSVDSEIYKFETQDGEGNLCM
jgi:hypothetical protein